MPLFPFDNSYARLPERFYTRLAPTPVREPGLVMINYALAADLGLDADALASPAGIAALAGNAPLPGAAPLAQVYAGHQFGGWSAQLGDGRAVLLGEVVGKDGERRDIQLKGSGPTPYSRMGDGRAPLGPVLREYIVSEAMAALGVPTTRALAAVTTGEAVLREEGGLPGGVLTRVAASHIRVGTFQYFSAQNDVDGLRLLTEHALSRHYPDAAGTDNPALALLRGVIARQARLIARWLSLGFIHGVMNTDNMTISGETIDYGPCAFMDGFVPDQKFSFIDQGGRYAFHMQPGIGHWNLSRLAIALVPLLAGAEEDAIDLAKAALDEYPALFEAAWLAEMGAKIGLSSPSPDDKPLIEALLSLMATERADFTLTFRAISECSAGDDAPVAAGLVDHTAFVAWAEEWRARLEAGGDLDGARTRMRAANPRFIPRNHQVEAAIEAGYHGDFGPFARLIDVLARPYDDQPGNEDYAAPPSDDQIVARTFCGT
ncbi:MAG: YdiU family protein [Pseudomonadota bacterium]